MSTRVKVGWLVLVFLCGVGTASFFFISTADTDTRIVDLTFPTGGRMLLSAANNSLDAAEMLNTIYSDETGRGFLDNWLDEEGFYHYTDDLQLADALATKLCDPIVENDPSREMNRLREECAQRAQRLRDLAFEREVPFHYVAQPVNVGVPEDPPRRGRANACRPGRFHGRRVQLTNELTGSSIEVVVSGSYPCTPGRRTPDIQLNRADAMELFNVPLMQYQQAVAVIL